jgi:ribonuclease HII
MGNLINLPPHLDDTKIFIGLDEAGRGSLAGPVVVAGVILPKDFQSDIVKDSKKLSEKKRKEAFELIKREAISWSVSFIGPEDIDDLNILQATMKGMHQCLTELEGEYNHILVDGNYFKPFKEVEHDCIIKGDNTYYSIAAASILAKVSRDEYMKKLHLSHPQYDWCGNKGYGSSAHIQKIKDIGYTEHHRKSFLKNIIQT